MEYTEKYFVSVDEALEDEAFAAKLAKAESKDQIRALFLNEKGIELEDGVAQAAYEKIDSIRSGGELTAEDLEAVAGGRRGRAYRAAVSYGASTGAQWGTQLWGKGFGTLLGAIVGAQITQNILNGRWC